MHFAFVTSLLPTGAADTGFEIANAAVIEALRAAGVRLTLFGVLRPGEKPRDDDAVVLDRIVIENAAASHARKLRWLAASMARNLPVISAKIAPLGAKLDAAMRQAGPFDACVVNSAPVAAAFPHLFGCWPCLLIAHNVEHASAMENSRSASGLAARLYAREARLLERAERSAAQNSRFVFTLAEEDRAGFGVDISGKSCVFPLLVPHLRAPAAPVEPVHDVGLIGTWTWQPNLIGLRWFLEHVAPQLPKDLRIGVAGRAPADALPTATNVTFLGRVPDAAAFVASCRVMALTSRAGTGIQLKTIETFQMGKPAVATKSSVRGFSDLPTNCLVADDAERFAAAVAKLVMDVKAERTAAADGAAFVKRQRDGMAQAVRMALAALNRTDRQRPSGRSGSAPALRRDASPRRPRPR